VDVFAALAGHAMGGRGDLRPVPPLDGAGGATWGMRIGRAMPAGSLVRLRVPAQRRRRRSRHAAPIADRNVHIERWP